MASEETSNVRHGRHSAPGRHAAPRVEEPSAEAPRAEEPSAAVPTSVPRPQTAQDFGGTTIVDHLGSTSEFVPISDGDQETNMSDAPRPIDVDPEETGSFRRISASEGARLTTRANAGMASSLRPQGTRPIEAVRMSSAGRPKVEHHEVEVQSNKRVYLLLGIGALIVMAIVITLLVRAVGSVEETTEPPVYEQAQATSDAGIDYRGTTYRVVEQAAGKYALVSTSEGSEGTAVLYELAGTPVTLILYNTVFVIPENLPDGTWDLIAHPLGGGSVTQQVTDADGNPIVGQGQITEATLSGDAILVTTNAGEQLSVSLV